MSYKKELCRYLYGILPRCTTHYISQSKYYYDFLDASHHLTREFSGGSDFPFNYETIYSVNTDKMYQDIQRVLKKSFNLGDSKAVIILEGFRLFDDRRIRNLVDMPVFLDVGEENLRFLITTHRTEDELYFNRYILPLHQQYLSRCRRKIPNLIEVHVALTSFSEIKKTIKRKLIEECNIKYRLLDFSHHSLQT